MSNNETRTVRLELDVRDFEDSVVIRAETGGLQYFLAPEKYGAAP